MIEIRYTLGFQSDKATAANAALFAGDDAKKVAAEIWAATKEALGPDLMVAPVDEVEPAVRMARMNAARYRADVDNFYGLATHTAAGLFFVTKAGHAGEVHETNHGSPYLRGVRFATWDVEGEQGWKDSLEEIAVEDVLAFVDSWEECVKILDARF